MTKKILAAWADFLGVVKNYWQPLKKVYITFRQSILHTQIA
jgi:hypothetical protein